MRTFNRPTGPVVWFLALCLAAHLPLYGYEQCTADSKNLIEKGGDCLDAQGTLLHFDEFFRDGSKKRHAVGKAK